MRDTIAQPPVPDTGIGDQVNGKQFDACVVGSQLLRNPKDPMRGFSCDQVFVYLPVSLSLLSG